MRPPVVLLLALAVGCESRSAASAPKVLAVDPPSGSALIGVDPERFECESVAPLGAVEAALDTPVDQAESPFKAPVGVPRPCTYVARNAERTTWSFDIDCRQRALDDAAALMVHYSTAEDARPVLVGESGLDHSGASLLFVDDDSPCYVRILGPDPDKRLALAREVASRLDERTAPTGARRQ